MEIVSAQKIEGTIQLPGDKSISHRAVLLAAIAEGTTRISNFLVSEDCLASLECVRSLGIEVRRSGSYVEVDGRGLYGLNRADTPLDCGNSGTTARLIAGILAGQKFDSVLTGDASLLSRPMRRIIDPLVKMGAVIDSEDGRLPLKVRGGRTLLATQHTSTVASAQVKSCILLAGLYADGETTVFEPTETRDHTERMLDSMGVALLTRSTDGGRSITVTGGSALSAIDISVPSDISSAAFFMVAAACLDGSIELNNVGLNPTRTGVLDVLHRAGVEINIENERISNGEPVGDIVVSSSRIDADRELVKLDGPIIANIIDEIPILAILGTRLSRGLEVRDAGELRVKETDRITAIVTCLRQMNAEVDEYEDGFRVHPSRLVGAEIDPFGDHRIAMAFAVAGTIAAGRSVITNDDCVSVSFPGFFELLKSVVR